MKKLVLSFSMLLLSMGWIAGQTTPSSFLSELIINGKNVLSGEPLEILMDGNPFEIEVNSMKLNADWRFQANNPYLYFKIYSADQTLLYTYNRNNIVFTRVSGSNFNFKLDRVSFDIPEVDVLIADKIEIYASNANQVYGYWPWTQLGTYNIKKDLPPRTTLFRDGTEVVNDGECCKTDFDSNGCLAFNLQTNQADADIYFTLGSSIDHSSTITPPAAILISSTESYKHAGTPFFIKASDLNLDESFTIQLQGKSTSGRLENIKSYTFIRKHVKPIIRFAYQTTDEGVNYYNTTIEPVLSADQATSLYFSVEGSVSSTENAIPYSSGTITPGLVYSIADPAVGQAILLDSQLSELANPYTLSVLAQGETDKVSTYSFKYISEPSIEMYSAAGVKLFDGYSFASQDDSKIYFSVEPAELYEPTTVRYTINGIDYTVSTRTPIDLTAFEATNNQLDITFGLPDHYSSETYTLSIPSSDFWVLELQYEQYNNTNEDLETTLTRMGYLNDQNRGPAGYNWFEDDQDVIRNNPGMNLSWDNPQAYLRSQYQYGVVPWINTDKTTYTGEENEVRGYRTYFVGRANSGTDYDLDYSSAEVIHNTIIYEIRVYVKPKEERDVEMVALFQENFGSPERNEGDLFGDPLPTGTTSYSYTDTHWPEDNEYTIICNPKPEDFLPGHPLSNYPLDWLTELKDHTSGGCYMYMVNADYETGKFYEHEVEVCAHVPLRFSLHIKNLVTGRRGSAEYHRKYRIKPNIQIKISGVTTLEDGTVQIEEIQSIYTGNVDMDKQWGYHFAEFTSNKSGKILVEYLNKNIGGHGNDFLIDDIRVERASGYINIKELKSDDECNDYVSSYQVSFDAETMYENFKALATELQAEKLAEYETYRARAEAFEAGQGELYDLYAKKAFAYFWQLRSSDEEMINYRPVSYYFYKSGILFNADGTTKGLIDNTKEDENNFTLHQYYDRYLIPHDIRFTWGKLYEFHIVSVHDSFGATIITTPVSGDFENTCFPYATFSPRQSIYIPGEGQTFEDSEQICSGDEVSLSLSLSNNLPENLHWYYTLLDENGNYSTDEDGRVVGERKIVYSGSEFIIQDINGNTITDPDFNISSSGADYPVRLVVELNYPNETNILFYIRYNENCLPYLTDYYVTVSPSISFDLRNETIVNDGVATVHNYVDNNVFYYRQCYADEFELSIPVQAPAGGLGNITARIDIYDPNGTSLKKENLNSGFNIVYLADEGNEEGNGTEDGHIIIYFNETNAHPLYWRNTNLSPWENFISGMHTAVLKVRVGYGSLSSQCSEELEINLRFISPQAVWDPIEAEMHNWNHDANWKIYKTDDKGNALYIDGILQTYEAEAGIPLLCTDVLLQGDEYYYPDLGDSKTPQNYNGQTAFAPKGYCMIPTCNSITFEMGSELNRQDILRYFEAYVEVNFGYYEDGAIKNHRPSSTIMNRDQYYMLSFPLQEMYVGDLFFGGKPGAHARYAKTDWIDTDELINSGFEYNWPDEYQQFIDNKPIFRLSSLVSDYDITLDFGHAFVYGVNSTDVENGDRAFYQPDREVKEKQFQQTNLNSQRGVIKYPRFRSASFGPQVSEFMGYTGSTNEAWSGFNHLEQFAAPVAGSDYGQTYFLFYYASDPDRVAPPYEYNEIVKRHLFDKTIDGVSKKVYNGNRFVAENKSILTFTSEDEHELLIGNPFIAHLSFDRFYQRNKQVVHNYFRIREGSTLATYYVDETTSEVYSVNGDEGALAEDEIDYRGYLAPMQGFFVAPQLLMKRGVTFTFNSQMTESKRRKKTKQGEALRSQATLTQELKLSLHNSLTHSEAVLIRKPEGTTLGEGAPLIISGNLDLPELFVKQNGQNKVITEISESEEIVSLGMYDFRGETEMSLEVIGIDRLPANLSLSIYDARENTYHPLSAENKRYTFKTYLDAGGGPIENRLFLTFKIDNSGIETVEGNNPEIKVWVNNHSIEVISEPYLPIERVQIYNVQGQLLTQEQNINRISYTSAQLNPGIYLVSITSQTGSFVKKVIVK